MISSIVLAEGQPWVWHHCQQTRLYSAKSSWVDTLFDAFDTEVTLHDGRLTPATVIAYDSENDLASTYQYG